jgi:TM2 domain-containing membrane protein YozV
MNQTCPFCGGTNLAHANTCAICHESLPSKKRSHITETFDAIQPRLPGVNLKSRQVTYFLFLILGFTGSGFFYLGYLFAGFLYALAHVFFGLYIALIYPSFTSVAILSAIIFQILSSFYILIRRTLKDVRGEFLK